MANTASMNLVLRFCDGRVEFAEVLFQGRAKNTCAKKPEATAQKPVLKK